MLAVAGLFLVGAGIVEKERKGKRKGSVSISYRNFRHRLGTNWYVLKL